MNSPPKTAQVPWFSALIFSAIFVCFYSALHFFYISQHNKIKSTIHNGLSIIADLKVLQISNWRQERIRDMQLFAGNPGFAEYVRTGGNGQLKKELLTLMHSARELQGYQNLMIADSHGLPRLSAIEESWIPPDPALIQKALTGGLPVLGDLTRPSGSGAIYLEIIAPLLQADRSLTPAGLMVARIDPRQFFYPFMQSWPSPSRTAETMLVRREGDSIIFLNELRHRKNTAMSLRESIKDKDLLSARLLGGETGVAEGIDYRGAPVLAEVRSVPDTPWLMVAKVDADEIFETLRLHAMAAFVVLGMLLLGAALFILGLWSRRQAAELARTAQFEAALRTEDGKLIDAFRSISDGIYICNSQYEIEYVNPALENIFGPVNGRPCYRYFHGRDDACPWCRIKEVFGGGTDRREWCSDRAGRQYDIVTTPLENPGGGFSALHFLRDITELKRSEAALKESEDALRGFVEQSRDGIALCDADGRIIEWNKGLEQMTQLLRADAIGRHIWDVSYSFFADEARDTTSYSTHKSGMEHIATTGENPWEKKLVEIVNQLPDGRRVHMQCVFFPVQTQTGFIWGAICRDITAGKLMEQALIASENKYRELVECANSIILRMDTRGTVLFFNAFAQQFFGYTEAEIIGRNVIGTIVPERESTGRNLERMISDICSCPETFMDNENENMCKSGDRVWICWSNKALHDQDGRVREILCVGHDITLRKKTDSALKESEMRLRSSQQRARLGDWEFDFRSNGSFWSDEMYRLLGYEPGGITPSFEAFIQHVHHEDRQCLLDASSYRENGRRRDSFRIVCNDGSIRHMSSEGWMVSDEAGAPILARGIVQDITGRKVIEDELSRHRGKLEELVTERTAALEKEMAERKKTEEELRASESRFKGLVANIPGVVYRVFCDHERPITDWTIEYVSASAEQLAGRPVSYFEGNTVGLYTSLIHPEDADTVGKKLAASISLNQPYALEYRILHSDGSYRWVMSRGQAFKDTNGRLLWLDGVILDITERRQAEQTLRESEERFRAIAESTPDAILITDADYSILYWNNGAASMFGYAAEEVLGKSHTFLLPPLQQQQEKKAINVLENSGRRSYEGTAFETVAVKKDGTLFSVELSIAFWTISEKTYGGVIIRDCTQRKKADEALRQSEAQFRAFADTSPDAVIITDMNLTILYWNTAAEKIFGYDRQEMLGRQPDCLMGPAALARQEKALAELNTTGRSPFMEGFAETSALKKEGVEFPCELAVFQWETAGRFFLGVILRDITARKMMQAEALQAAHLASIGELAAGVAHEINNPINGIINCADILKYQFEKRGEDGDIPGRIIKEGERVARIVKNLLTFAREQKGKMEPQNVSVIYADAFALLAKQLEKDFILARQDFPEGLPPVLAQPQQIQQVFINLLSNARYALNKKYPDKDPGKQLDITARPIVFDSQQYVRIIFHDRGTGVSESDLEKLCNPFFTTKPAGEGTGLGLSISHNIIQDHSGRILFETSQGEYMRVMIDLPAVVSESP